MTILASVYRAFGCLFCWALALFIYPLSVATLSDSDLHIEPQFIAETLTPKAGTKVTVALEMKPIRAGMVIGKTGVMPDKKPK